MHIAGVAFRKSCFAVAEVVLPVSAEMFVITKGFDPVFVLLKLLSPFIQGSGVVGANVVKIQRPEVSFFGRRSDHGGNRWYTTSGEDAGADVVDFFEVSFVAMIGHGDALYHGGPGGLQEVRDFGEIGGEVFMAYGFDHFDGDNAVEFALQFSVVFFDDGDLATRSFILHSFQGIMKLFLRDGGGR